MLVVWWYGVIDDLEPLSVSSQTAGSELHAVSNAPVLLGVKRGPICDDLEAA